MHIYLTINAVLTGYKDIHYIVLYILRLTIVKVTAILLKVILYTKVYVISALRFRQVQVEKIKVSLKFRLGDNLYSQTKKQLLSVQILKLLPESVRILNGGNRMS